MALVDYTRNDFSLFRDSSIFDMPDEQQDGTYTHFHYSMDNGFPVDLNNAFMSFRPPMPYNNIISYQDTPQLIVDAPNDPVKQIQQRYTPSASPSMSLAQSLDHTHTTLSTSCPSIKSTASSTVSSPYSHATHSIPSQDQWMDANALGIANGFKTEDSYSHDSYSIPRMEGDQLLFENNHFPDNFVGESRAISSTVVANSPKAPLPMSSASNSQALPCSTISSSHLPTGSTARDRNITIDTILEDVNGRNSGALSMISPVSAPSSVKQITATTQRARSVGALDHCSSNFKSPSTPASVMSPFASRSSTPFISRRQSSVIPEHSEVKNGPSDSLRTQQHPQPNPAPSSPDHYNRPYFPTPFFTQSSGRFVAPLESSCWFSLAVSLFFFGTFSVAVSLSISQLQSIKKEDYTDLRLRRSSSDSTIRYPQHAQCNTSPKYDVPTTPTISAPVSTAFSITIRCIQPRLSTAWFRKIQDWGHVPVSAVKQVYSIP